MLSRFSRKLTTVTNCMKKNKAIFIVGTTGKSCFRNSFLGVGKTKLSIELAKKYNGEIINADVMQMYKGVSVATAKVGIILFAIFIGYYRGERWNTSPPP